jgi:DNA-binding Lrp family transcriptional regulator
MFEFDVLFYNYFCYNTLDVDWDIIPDINLSCSKEHIDNIIAKIQKCPNLAGLVKEDSNKKGYHLRFYCKKECDLCRLVFDDYIRYDADRTRKKEFTNIMFDSKKGY